jgi:hypothetical protein
MISFATSTFMAFSLSGLLILTVAIPFDFDVVTNAMPDPIFIFEINVL